MLWAVFFFPAQSLLIFQPRIAQIHHILRNFFPNCRILKTGSSVLVGSQEYRRKIYVCVH